MEMEFEFESPSKVVSELELVASPDESPPAASSTGEALGDALGVIVAVFCALLDEVWVWVWPGVVDVGPVPIDGLLPVVVKGLTFVGCSVVGWRGVAVIVRKVGDVGGVASWVADVGVIGFDWVGRVPKFVVELAICVGSEVVVGSP